MRISKISVYQVDVPIKPATISHERVMSAFDVTYVRIETDAGVEGPHDRNSVGRRDFQIENVSGAVIAMQRMPIIDTTCVVPHHQER